MLPQKTLPSAGLLLFAGLAGLLLAGPALAHVIHERDGDTLGVDVEAMAAVMHSRKTYVEGAGRNWQEAYLKATLTGSTTRNGLKLYGGLGGIALGTFGDGDAGGYTRGDERRAKIEDAYAGLRSANGFIDFSLGRQKFQLGDGFLISGDAISLGNGPLVAGARVNRGGAYYIAAQKSFDNTAILRVNPEGVWRASLFWLGSDVAYHQETKLAGLDLEHVDPRGTLAASYLEVLDVKKDRGLGLWNKREGMRVYNLRAQGNLGVENLFLAAEYVAERGGDQTVKNHGSAWYIETGWTFAAAPLAPTLNYRHARFSADRLNTRRDESFDPLFFGLSRGLGTWFQGEVAANYAGPANSGNRVDRLEFTLSPRPNLPVTLQLWNFRHLGDAPRVDGREADLFVWWQVNDHTALVPLLGLYKPRGQDVKAAQGDGGTNVYLQFIVLLTF
jgi:hypothetical protein